MDGNLLIDLVKALRTLLYLSLGMNVKVSIISLIVLR
jgi:hypothetical protein